MHISTHTFAFILFTRAHTLVGSNIPHSIGIQDGSGRVTWGTQMGAFPSIVPQYGTAIAFDPIGCGMVAYPNSASATAGYVCRTNTQAGAVPYIWESVLDGAQLLTGVSACVCMCKCDWECMVVGGSERVYVCVCMCVYCMFMCMLYV